MIAARITFLALTLAWAGACTTETQTGATASLVDASAPSITAPVTAATDAPLAVADAGALPGIVDAGAAAIDAGATATSEAPREPKHGTPTPFDRILVKPKAASGDVEALKALVENKTGHKLALVRRTAGKWLLLQFAPTAKGRDQSDQSKLVDVLKGMDELAAVEGDRLMKVKQP